jgi:hypothetical protein
MENAALCRDAAAMPGRGASHFLVILIKVKVRLLHRRAMPENSRGLSDQRYPRKAFPDIRILEGCQTFCDLSEVVNARVFSGGVGIPLARDASTPGYLLLALRADGKTS